MFTMYYYEAVFPLEFWIDLKELGEKEKGNQLIMAILHYFQLADFEVSGIFITGILEKSIFTSFLI